MVARQEAEQLGEPPRQAVRSYRAPPPASPLPVPGAERDGCTGRARPTSIHQLNPSKRGSICIWDLSPTLAISSVRQAEPHCAQPPLKRPAKSKASQLDSTGFRQNDACIKNDVRKSRRTNLKLAE